MILVDSSLFLKELEFLYKGKFIGVFTFNDIKKYLKRKQYLTFKFPKILFCFSSNSNSEFIILF